MFLLQLIQFAPLRTKVAEFRVDASTLMVNMDALTTSTMSTMDVTNQNLGYVCVIVVDLCKSGILASRETDG